MNKILIIIVLIASGCANRGYRTLSQEVPELFPDFKAENYEKKETPKNIVYTEKVLPQSEKDKKEFHEKEYVFKKGIKSYNFHVPRARLPSSGGIDLLIDIERIKTTFDKNTSAILIR